MPRLSQILKDHSPVLLLDAASERVQAGYFHSGGWAWAAAEKEAGVGLFECLDALGADVNAIKAFAFCEGPGSILGIRTVAMALRTWMTTAARPVFAYRSLALVAEALGAPVSDASAADANRSRPPASDALAVVANPSFAPVSDALTVDAPSRRVPLFQATNVALISDARRGFWHRYTRETGLTRVPAADLTGPLATPQGFRHWAPLPPGTVQTPYNLEALFARTADAALFRPVESPDAFLAEEPAYAAWTPRMHAAP